MGFPGMMVVPLEEDAGNMAKRGSMENERHVLKERTLLTATKPFALPSILEDRDHIALDRVTLCSREVHEALRGQ